MVEKVETGDRVIVKGHGEGTALNPASNPDDGISVKIGPDGSVGPAKRRIRVRLSQIEKVVGRATGSTY